MKVAVLSLCRDRLDYTKHCFAALQRYAGCDYDHYVLDQGSTDGTDGWLLTSDYECDVTLLGENIGIARGMNMLLGVIAKGKPYDAIVKIDNDCAFTQPNTLRDLCQLVSVGKWMLSPRILGLLNPPQPTRQWFANGGEVILDIPQIGGICLAAPGWIYDTYRFPDSLPTWGWDDVHLCQYFRAQGGTCGYVKRLEAWHYEGTEAQRQRFPEYWQRKQAEMAA